jgi:hypothetical protein
MVPAKLPAPLSSLQAAVATEAPELRHVFSVLAGAVGCALPEIDVTPFVSKVQNYENDTRTFKKMAAKTPIALTSGLSPHELATLVEIAEQTPAPGETVGVRWLKDALEKSGYRGVAATLALKMLARKDLIEILTETDPNSYGDDEYSVVRLSEEGWMWLEENQDMLVLKTDTAVQVNDAYGPPSEEDIPF